MKEQWLAAFGQMTYGIYVLTVQWENTINGMIASWVTQVSYDPPLIQVAVHPNRYSHDLIERGGIFALHVLACSQKHLLKRFKDPDIEKKFSGIDWKAGKFGSPILENCIAWFELKLKERHAPGNHTLFIGQVIDSGIQSGNPPLCTLDYDGRYVGKN